MVRALPYDVDGFRLLAEIARGGMGVVYRGVEVGLERPVAIKMMLPSGTDDLDTVKARFVREAKSTARIESAHIVKLFRAGVTDDDELYLAMELLQGRTLAEVIQREGPLPPDRVRKICRQIAVALEAAHRAGVVHRDIKAANVVLVEQDGDPEFVKVLDLGVATLVDEKTRITRSGALIGTPGYIAPEQLQGAAVSPSGDLYALGALMFRMLTGEELFVGADWKAVCFQHLSVPATPPSARVPGRTIPKDLDTLTLTLLQKEPEARLASATAVREFLDGKTQAQATDTFDIDPVPTLPDVAPTEMLTGTGPAPRPYGAVALGLVAVAALAAGVWFFAWAPAPPAEPGAIVVEQPDAPPPLRPAAAVPTPAAAPPAPEPTAAPADEPADEPAPAVATPAADTSRTKKKAARRRGRKKSRSSTTTKTVKAPDPTPPAAPAEEPGLMRRRTP